MSRLIFPVEIHFILRYQLRDSLVNLRFDANLSLLIELLQECQHIISEFMNVVIVDQLEFIENMIQFLNKNRIFSASLLYKITKAGSIWQIYNTSK